MIVGHGGNIHSLARQIGCAPGEILDMSSNINPQKPGHTTENVPNICWIT